MLKENFAISACVGCLLFVGGYSAITNYTHAEQINLLRQSKTELETQIDDYGKRIEELVQENIKLQDTIGNKVYECIPMTVKEQLLVAELSEQYNLESAFMYGVISHESSFNNSAVGHNTNGTYDTGYMQINSSNRKWVNDLLGKDADISDPLDNIRAGFAIIDFYRNYWQGKGINDQYLMDYALSSYNAGIGGTNRQFRKSYVTKVNDEITAITKAMGDEKRDN